MISPLSVRKFHEDGYLIIPNVFAVADCEKLRAEIWKLMPSHFREDDEESWQGRVQDCCTNLTVYGRKGLMRFKDKSGYANNPAFKQLVYDNPAIGRIFTELTGVPLQRAWIRGAHPVLPMPARVSINEMLGNRISPNVAKWGGALKLPAPPQFPIPGHLDVHSFEIGAMLYLNDVSEEGGALSVWPGSHVLFNLAFDGLFDFVPTGLYKRALSLLQSYKSVPLAAGAGAAIFFHNRLLHSNSINRTKATRFGVLIDLFGEGWRERDLAARGQEPQASERRRLNVRGRDSIRKEPVYRTVTAGYRRDAVRAFWVDHPRLKAVLHKIGQDPAADGRRALSRKIRSRSDGDTWVVVSQSDEFSTSWKLDASGDPQRGAYKIKLNGSYVGRSCGGILVERLNNLARENVLEISGKFDVPHYVRIVRTASPLRDSKLLLSSSVKPGRNRSTASFNFIGDIKYSTSSTMPSDPQGPESAA